MTCGTMNNMPLFVVTYSGRSESWAIYSNFVKRLDALGAMKHVGRSIKGAKK